MRVNDEAAMKAEDEKEADDVSTPHYHGQNHFMPCPPSNGKHIYNSSWTCLVLLPPTIPR